jgi:MoaA/NifB/PqqE/SkfB family radical SAM enzyme
MTTRSPRALPPARVSFNFLVKCNMTCAYCYCPFSGIEVDRHVCRRIIDRLADWRVESVTFGGGDPLMYGDDFVELLTYTRMRIPGVFLQVDTNGIGVTRPLIEALAGNVDLIGLPLDGPNAEIHRQMRGSPSHFDLVSDLARTVSKMSRLKINTVVGRPNVDHLIELGTLLREMAIHRWSLYEFWPLGSSGTSNAARYTLSPKEFNGAIEDLMRHHRDLPFEIGSVDARWHSYFFVSHTGDTYTVDRANRSEYRLLGSILDDEVLTRWHEHADLEAGKRRYRLRMTDAG